MDKSKAAIKVLFVCTVPTGKSGIPNVIFNLIRGFDRSDMQIGYVAINQPDHNYCRELDDLGVKLYVIPRELRNPIKYLQSLTDIARGYDIIHAHGNSATLVLEMLAGKMAGVKLRIAHSHNTSCSAKLIDRLMRPVFYRLCNGRMACGNEAGKWLFKDRSFLIVNNGILSSRFLFNPDIRIRIRQELNISDDIYLIGNIANFVEAKNHRFLIKIFSIVYNRNPKVRLVLLGDGPLRNEIYSLTESYGIRDAVIFAGSVENPSDYMSAVDMIVMPSLFEGLPLTLIEEQANGLVALVSDAITREADMTGNINFMSLECGESKWADTIENLKEKQGLRSIEDSDRAIKKIIDSGYDITAVSASLKAYYYNNMLE